MKIHTAQMHLTDVSYKSEYQPSDDDGEMNAPTSQSHALEAEKEETRLTLSSKAMERLNRDKETSNKAYGQQRAEYEEAKKEYREKVNELPSDYRKMKETKDRIDEEIKTLKAEIEKIKQSATLDEEEEKKAIQALEQQIATKTLEALEIRKEFTKQLKEQERSKQISPEDATSMLKTFNSSPPEEPVESL